MWLHRWVLPMTSEGRSDDQWFVYIIECDDNALYTGISVDVQRRVEQHRSGRGAKFFRSRRVRRLVYLEAGHSRSTATRREMAIKRLSPAGKRSLLDSDANLITDRR